MPCSRRLDLAVSMVVAGVPFFAYFFRSELRLPMHFITARQGAVGSLDHNFELMWRVLRWIHNYGKIANT